MQAFTNIIYINMLYSLLRVYYTCFEQYHYEYLPIFNLFTSPEISLRRVTFAKLYNRHRSLIVIPH